MTSHPATSPADGTTVRRPRGPANPLPDFRRIFLEPVFSGPAAGEAGEEDWQDDEPQAADGRR
ncbi:hypothetical protein [Streptomyces sp. NPDC003023]|uniref:hypothetical protein n=1 Tax=Streptomyces sp. NPDC003023 TaxID=3364675 RepID=UPI0036C5F0FF